MTGPATEHDTDLKKLTQLSTLGQVIWNNPNSYVFLYLTAITLANLLTTWLGPTMSVVNALLFIGLDLTARDKLHDAWHGKNLAMKMTILIATGSIISFILNKNSAQIAIASLIAFALANITDTIIYNLLRKKPYLTRINTSNIASATVDSITFPIIAFGLPVMWGVVVGQLLAKTLGGAAWAIIFKKLSLRK